MVHELLIVGIVDTDIYPIVDFEVVGTLIYNGLSGLALKLAFIDLLLFFFFNKNVSIGWVWSIQANAGCHEHRRSKFALMNIQISKCDPYGEKFLLTESVIKYK